MQRKMNMIYIEFTQSNYSSLIHSYNEIECKLSMKFQADYLELTIDELFYERNYSDIALLLVNMLERVLNNWGITCSIHLLDKLVEQLLANKHSFIQVDERFLSK